jgi:hypothetical protein
MKVPMIKEHKHHINEALIPQFKSLTAAPAE